MSFPLLLFQNCVCMGGIPVLNTNATPAGHVNSFQAVPAPHSSYMKETYLPLSCPMPSGQGLQASARHPTPSQTTSGWIANCHCGCASICFSPWSHPRVQTLTKLGGSFVSRCYSVLYKGNIPPPLSRALPIKQHDMHG